MQEQQLVGLAGPVDADVGEGPGRQQTSEGVEGLGPDRLAVGKVRVACSPWGAARVSQPWTVGSSAAVGVEHPIHVSHVAGAEGGLEDRRVPKVPVVAAGQPGVIGHVARGLLQVRHEPAPLEDLGQEVGRLLAGQVHAAQLGDRVVAVLEEDPVVELLGPTQPDGGVDGQVAADVEIADELVQEQPAQALGRAGVAGEQRSLHHLREVHQREDGPVHAREVPPEDVGLRVTEALPDVWMHVAPHYGPPPLAAVIRLPVRAGHSQTPSSERRSRQLGGGH